ncbi:MAG: hypothetical protein K2G41_05750, partial [Duncaniella sp.]|uniref:hypothetical protein n=1 Tax=Duncaniella sp. TaxID=2518496 RepID=UPI0023C8158A
VSMFNLTTGCSSGGRELDGYLERAEELMEPSPDSAYSILTDSITPAMLSGASERQSALHALLLTQSRFKTYVPVDNDSLITSAVKYFEKKDDRSRLMKSLYYQARILRDNGEYSDAMSAAMHGRAIAQYMKEDFWQARCAELIARMFSTFYHLNESIRYGEEAADLYRKLGRTNFYIYILSDQGLRYNNIKNFGKCKEVLDSISVLLDNTEMLSTTQRNSILATSASTAQSMLISIKEYDKAEQIGDTILKYEKFLTNMSSECACIAKVKLKLGKISEARAMLEYTLPKLEDMRDSLFYYDALKDYNEMLGDVEGTLAATEMSLKLYGEAFGMVSEQTVMYAHRDYYSEEMTRIEKIAERNRQLLVVCIALAIALILIGVLLYRNRINKKNADISKKMTEIMLLSRTLQQTYTEKESLNQKLTEHDADMAQLSSVVSRQNSEIEELSANVASNQDKNDKLNSMVGSLLQGRFSQLNNIISEYAEQEENRDNYLAFYKNIKQEIDKFKLPKTLEGIENIVDECMGGVITNIREGIPTMREKDITFIALVLAGFNARAIGLFLGMHPNSTYKRKRQLIKIVEASEVQNRDRIVEMLIKPKISDLLP